MEEINQPYMINDAAQSILYACVFGNPAHVGGEIMFLGESCASNWINIIMHRSFCEVSF